MNLDQTCISDDRKQKGSSISGISYVIEDVKNHQCKKTKKRINWVRSEGDKIGRLGNMSERVCIK